MIPDKAFNTWWTGARQGGYKTLVLACFVFVLCYLTAELGGLLEVHVPQPVWLLWPGCAILAAVLLMKPRKLWPLLMGAGLSGFVLYDVRVGLPAITIVCLILADIAEIMTAAIGVHFMFKGQPEINGVRTLIQYCAFAVLLAPLIAATAGAGLTQGHYWISWRISFLSEALAFLTLPPAIFGWSRLLQTRGRESSRHFLEIGVLILGVFAIGYVISVTSHRSVTPALFYALVPFLIWSALRFGSLGVSTAIIIIAFLAISGAMHGRGPFTGSSPLANVLSLQAFLLCAATPFMVLAALAEAHKRTEWALRELGGRLITAQEEERARIARELHDDLSQRMARLLIRLDRCRQGMVEISTKSRAQLDTVCEMASEVSGSLRNLSHMLHPATLANLGLETSIASFCSEFSEQHQVAVKFVCRNVPKDTSEAVNLCMFRVVQEALRNVAKHSATNEACVTLTSDGSELSLCIEDPGIGFDSKYIERKASLGLVSMRERVRLVGGQFSIHSHPSVGTRIQLQIPIDKATPPTSRVKSVDLENKEFR